MGGFNGLQNSLSINYWLLAATVPAILSVSGDSWIGALFVGLLCCTALSLCKLLACPRWFCVLQLLWLPVFLAVTARESAVCWESNDPAIPIILILLGAMASRKGSVPAVSIGKILFWLIIPILLIAFLTGTADIHWEWLSADIQMPDGVLIGILLLPGLVTFLPAESNKKTKYIPWVLAVMAIATAIVIQGTGAISFYELSKGITLLGTAERLESLVACTVTMGWFALFTVVFSVIFHLAEKIFSSAGKYSVWICAVAAAVLVCILPKNDKWIAWGTLIFWGFLPLLTQGLVGTKKVVKK